MAKLIPLTRSIPTSWAARLVDSLLLSYRPEQWQWHYEHGLFVKAIYETGCAMGDPALQEFARTWLDSYITCQGDILTYRAGDFNLDQINPGKLLFPFYLATGEARYAHAIHTLIGQLRDQPRTPSGGFWHKKIYPNQMWLDGLYMAAPFYAAYAHYFHAPEIFADAARQFILIEQHARDPHTGLLYHAWDESKEQRWADPHTGCSPHFWGRAMGWYVMALVDVLDFWPQQEPNRAHLIEILNRLAAALLLFQNAGSGLWYQVVDCAGKAGNYQESSVSAMLAYGFAKGVRKGYLEPEALTSAQRAYQGLLAHKIRINADNSLILDGICSVAGLGGDPYRDGSYAYYVKEPVAANDFKGAGPFILASLEMELAAVRPAGIDQTGVS